MGLKEDVLAESLKRVSVKTLKRAKEDYDRTRYEKKVRFLGVLIRDPTDRCLACETGALCI